MTHAARRSQPTRSNAREQLPRALVGRRRPTFHDVFEQENPPKFSVGDMLKFQKSDGYVWYLTILGFRPGGVIDAMYYDGLPRPFLCTLSELSNLRIIEIKTMSQQDIDSYRAELGMNPKPVN